MTLSIATYHYAERLVFFIIMLNVFKSLSAVMLNVVILNVMKSLSAVMLNVVMLNAIKLLSAIMLSVVTSIHAISQTYFVRNVAIT